MKPFPESGDSLHGYAQGNVRRRDPTPGTPEAVRAPMEDPPGCGQGMVPTPSRSRTGAGCTLSGNLPTGHARHRRTGEVPGRITLYLPHTDRNHRGRGGHGTGRAEGGGAGSGPWDQVIQLSRRMVPVLDERCPQAAREGTSSSGVARGVQARTGSNTTAAFSRPPRVAERGRRVLRRIYREAGEGRDPGGDHRLHRGSLRVRPGNGDGSLGVAGGRGTPCPDHRGGRRPDLWVSTIPTSYREKVVIQILDSANVRVDGNNQ